jgi:hypothetical protein
MLSRLESLPRRSNVRGRPPPNFSRPLPSSPDFPRVGRASEGMPNGLALEGYCWEGRPRPISAPPPAVQPGFSPSRRGTGGTRNRLALAGCGWEGRPSNFGPTPSRRPGFPRVGQPLCANRRGDGGQCLRGLLFGSAAWLATSLGSVGFLYKAGRRVGAHSPGCTDF